MKWPIKIIFFAVIPGIIVGVIFVFFLTGEKSVLHDSVVSSTKVTEIDWTLLQTLSPESSNIPNALRNLNGVSVKIPGFMIPLEDNQDFVQEFLFVPTPMACIHVPPPPQNQIIHVVMASGKTAKMSYGPVWLIGKMMISERESKLVKASFQMTGSQVLPYQ